MELNTKNFGVLNIDESAIINFADGLPGFEELKKYVLLGKTEEDAPFGWLQSVDNLDLAFVVMDPFAVVPEYEVDIDDEKIKSLQITDMNKVVVLTIVVIPEDITKMTTNLRAPVVINLENKRGKQVVLDNTDYQIKHSLSSYFKQRTGGK